MDSDIDGAGPQPFKRTLHQKRSFGKHPKLIDSPAYDASEEDNDPLTDDAASAVSVPLVRTANSSNARQHMKHVPGSRARHHLASSLLSDDGIDSPTYDGDIESSTTAGPDSHFSIKPSSSTIAHHHHTSSTSTFNTTLTSLVGTSTLGTQHTLPSPTFRSAHHPVFISHGSPLRTNEEAGPAVPSKRKDNPAQFTPEDILAFVQKAIDGETWRKYKIRPPPQNRQVRVYADGVYDLFHFGHALQLRQAKLSFPSVYLLVGVCSDELVKAYKSRSIMSHSERCEAARHCRWVDEVVPEAPWVINDEFLQKWKIDYVAHDEDPYAASGHEDVYSYVKSQGKFIPTRRTPGVSTSELLERIVSGYRRRDFDEKLAKMGHAELRAEGSDYDAHSSRSMSPAQHG